MRAEEPGSPAWKLDAPTPLAHDSCTVSRRCLGLDGREAEEAPEIIEGSVALYETGSRKLAVEGMERLLDLTQSLGDLLGGSLCPAQQSPGLGVGTQLVVELIVDLLRAEELTELIDEITSPAHSGFLPLGVPLRLVP